MNIIARIITGLTVTVASILGGCAVSPSHADIIIPTGQPGVPTAWHCHWWTDYDQAKCSAPDEGPLDTWSISIKMRNRDTGQITYSDQVRMRNPFDGVRYQYDVPNNQCVKEVNFTDDEGRQLMHFSWTGAGICG